MDRVSFILCFEIMTDMAPAYRWGGYKQTLSKEEIEKMRKNMKKIPVIESKSDLYHLKESKEAQQLLTKAEQLLTKN